MSHPTSIIAKAGPIALTIAGSSAASASTATVIVATGGAAALVLVGYGFYKYLKNDSNPKHSLKK